MICVHHSKDCDGWASGAVIKKKFPKCKLIGWDYNDPIPWKQLPAGETIILIDITFPLEDLIALSKDTDLYVIDHHVSFKRQYDEWVKEHSDHPEFNYVYEAGKAACEVGWNYYFPGDVMPLAIRLLGAYDTWRHDEPGLDWDNMILPFQYYAQIECTSPDTFPESWFSITNVEIPITIGKSILKYQDQINRLACERSAFERTFHGLNAICLNARAFNSDMLKSVYDPRVHDIMVGIEYTGRNWSVSLRSDKDTVDVSVIAKSRGGGGHKFAAAFQCNTLEEIWDIPTASNHTPLNSNNYESA